MCKLQKGVLGAIGILVVLWVLFLLFRPSSQFISLSCFDCDKPEHPDDLAFRIRQIEKYYPQLKPQLLEAVSDGVYTIGEDRILMKLSWKADEHKDKERSDRLIKELLRKEGEQ